jgi:hypothetical protein
VPIGVLLEALYFLRVDYATTLMGGGTDRHETAAAVASFRPRIVMAIAGDPRSSLLSMRSNGGSR